MTLRKPYNGEPGELEIGTNGRGEVIVNHPELDFDENGVGHIVFSPLQARNLAKLLLKHAAKAQLELNAAHEPS